MISRVIKKTVELNKIQKVDQLEGPLYQLENAGHTFEITCLMNGAAADISGTVSGRFLRADETTVYFTGTLSGNVASITLPQSCYNVNGRFGFVVFISGSDVTTAIYAVAGSVYKSTSDTIIDPTGEIPSLEELLAEIDACEAATAAATAASAFVPNVIAPAYSASATYAVGDYVTKDNYLYQCNTAISTAEAWTAAHWTQVKVGGELSDLKSAIRQVETSYIQCESGTYQDQHGDVKANLNTRIRNVRPVPIRGYSAITVPDGYSMWIFRLDKDGGFISAVGAWKTGTVAISSFATAQTKFINFGIKNNSTPSADISSEVSTVASGIVLTEAVDDIRQECETISSDLFSATFNVGNYINGSGVETANNSFKCTGYIPLFDVLVPIKYTLYQQSGTNIVSYYDADKHYISGVEGNGNTTPKTGKTEFPDNAKYVRFSHCISSGGITNPAPILRIADVENNKIGYNVVDSTNLKNGSVTRTKCDFIIHDPDSNYIDKTAYSNGYINSSGEFVSNASWRATDYIALQPETQYYSSQLHGGYCAFYKADKTVIAAYGAYAYTVSSFTTPALTAYARFSINVESYDPSEAWLFTLNEKPKDFAYVLDGVGVTSGGNSNPCDYSGNEISVFNKILCVGDSMTEGTFNHLDSGSTQWVTYSKYAYPKFLQKMSGVDVTNLGHGGKTSVEWYELEENSDLSGYDCAIIQLGINDYGTYGELGDDTKTAFENIIDKLKTDNKNIKIFVANIIPATSYSTSGYKDFSDDLLDWLETEYASDDDVIPVDIQQYGHTGDSSAYNCGHLSALGYHRLAEDWKGYISWYISKHKDVFREVQFIGTDYWYVNPNS